jgi:hypothetical protein
VVNDFEDGQQALVTLLLRNRQSIMTPMPLAKIVLNDVLSIVGITLASVIGAFGTPGAYSWFTRKDSSRERELLVEIGGITTKLNLSGLNNADLPEQGGRPAACGMPNAADREYSEFLGLWVMPK